MMDTQEQNSRQQNSRQQVAPSRRLAWPRALRPKPSWLLHIALSLLAILFAFPFYWMIVVATSTTAEMFSTTPRMVPGDQFFNNLAQVFSGSPFGRALLNSAFLAVLNTCIYVLLASLAGFVFAKFKFVLRDTLFKLLLFTMILPSGVTLVTSFQIYADFGWINTYLPLIVPGAVSAFGVFWMRQVAMESIPGELIQASSIDGANFGQQYWYVALPCMLPGITALTIFQLMWNWNEYLWPLLVLNDPQLYTVPVSLAQLKSLYDDYDYAIVMAGTLVATIPLLVIFLLFRRTVMENTTGGAVKG